LLLSHAHARAVRARAQRESERVKYDGFARPGFAGKRNHTAIKFDVEAINKDEISDGELS
jgi:hypothetical protein